MGENKDMSIHGVIKLYGQGNIEVEMVYSYLADLEHAYNSIFVFESIDPHYFPMSLFLLPYRGRRLRFIRFIQDWPPSPKEIASLVPIRDRLVMVGVSLSSPGFWEFLGSLNPLEVIRQYLNDRHERRKDREYRESAEARRLELENLKLENEVLKERIKILKELGIEDRDLAPLLNELVFRPLRALGYYQDRGVIERAEISSQDRK